MATMLGIFGSVLFFAKGVYAKSAAKEAEEAEAASVIGGGYAVTGQLEGATYSAMIYDATNGLPTSDANYVFGASDGYVWIGGYSGVFRYDGTNFERMDPSDGLANARGIFEDSKGRIWVATNDTGVVLVDGIESHHITYKDGLPSSSIRTFAEDASGTIFVGTTAGVCYIDEQMRVVRMEDVRLDEERILKMMADRNGTIYGQTSNGLIFKIEEKQIKEVLTSEELGMEKITTLLTDPDGPGKVYLGTEAGVIYHGLFGRRKSQMEEISVAPLETVHWLSYDCGRVWISSTTDVGYLDEEGKFHLITDLPINSAIEMTCSDYQGNIWLASSTKGVMKLVTNHFVNVFEQAGLKKDVANATCMHNGMLYIGMDNGLYILDKNGRPIKNALTDYIGDARVRCIKADKDDNIWVSTYTNDLGLVCCEKNGEIRSFTTENGLASNEIRCCMFTEDGTTIAGTNAGVAVIAKGRVTETYGVEEGLKNTVILTVEEGEDGTIYAGSDGGGIYAIKDGEITSIGRDDGLTSDVILRIRRDDVRDLFWIITSNSIEYIKDGRITEVTSFPYNNNYDLFFDENGNIWILSSYGIYVVDAEDMVTNAVSDYRLYTVASGVTSIPTANGNSVVDEDGNLFIAGRDGVCRVNIDHFVQERLRVNTAINSVYCDDERILPDEKETYVIPASDGRIRITASVLDYSLYDPTIRVFFEGKEEDGIEATAGKLTPLEYTALHYGDYKLHVQVLSGGGDVISDDVYAFTKKPQLKELASFRVLMFLITVLIAGFVVWRIMRGTLIRRQYEEIRQAKEEAERANSAKTRFLANMSNEIRTPIHTILGMNELSLRADATDVPKEYYRLMQAYSVNIRDAAQSLLGLVNDLFHLSRFESGQMEVAEREYNTSELLRSLIPPIEIQCSEKELKFELVADEILPARLFGDDTKIRQILMNLLLNAVKYTKTGSVTFSVAMMQREGDSCELRFSVKDTGLGLKEEELDSLFSAYDSMEDESGSAIRSAGLGLGISRRLAGLMNGELSCESEYGVGTEFILTLPQKIVDATPARVWEEEQVRSKGYVPKFIAPDADVLIADDSQKELEVIRGLLYPTKVFVSTADSADECLDKIKETPFHIVFIEDVIAGVPAEELLGEIRAIAPSLGVYVMTADRPESETYYTDKGFDGYLLKPIESAQLEEAIMRHLPASIMEKTEG